MSSDYAKVFVMVNSEGNSQNLQADQQALNDWSEIRQLPFNASRCESMHLGYNNTKFHWRMKNSQSEITTM